MSSRSQLAVYDTFSGIGGFSYGLHATGGFRTVGFCERDPACQWWLNRLYPNTPIDPDITLVDGNELTRRYGRIDLICGGWPCQDISVAGWQEGLGTKEAPTQRSGLFYRLAQIVDDARPSWILFENVAGLKNLGADVVFNELQNIGYTCWPTVVSAENVGAPHKRERVWCVGYDVRQLGDSELHGSLATAIARGIAKTILQCEKGTFAAFESARASSSADMGEAAEELADAESLGMEGLWSLWEQVAAVQTEKRLSGRYGDSGRIRSVYPSRPGERVRSWEAPRLASIASLESPMGIATDGLPRELSQRRRIRSAQLKAAGNSIVPMIAAVWGDVILDANAVITAQLNEK